MGKIRVGNPGDSPLDAALRNNWRVLKKESNGDIAIRANLAHLSGDFFDQDDAYILRACSESGDNRPEVFRMLNSFAIGEEYDTEEQAARREGYKILEKDFMGLICKDEYGRKMRVEIMNGPWASAIGWID